MRVLVEYAHTVPSPDVRVCLSAHTGRHFVVMIVLGTIYIMLMMTIMVNCTSYHSIPAVHYSCNPGMRIKHSLFLYSYLFHMSTAINMTLLIFLLDCLLVRFV